MKDKLITMAQNIGFQWQGTDPMGSESEVRQALEAYATGGDIEAEDIPALLPHMIRVCRERGLLIDPT